MSAKLTKDTVGDEPLPNIIGPQKKKRSPSNVKRKDSALPKKTLTKQKLEENDQRTGDAIVNGVQMSKGKSLKVYKSPPKKTNVLSSKRKLGSPGYQSKGKGPKHKGTHQGKQRSGDNTDKTVVNNNKIGKDDQTCDNDTKSNTNTHKSSREKSAIQNSNHMSEETAETNPQSVNTKSKPAKPKTNIMKGATKKHRSLTHSKIKGSNNSPRSAKRLDQKKTEKKPNNQRMRASDKLLAIAKSIQLDDGIHYSNLVIGESSGLTLNQDRTAKTTQGKGASVKNRKNSTSHKNLRSPSQRTPRVSQDLNTAVKTMRALTSRSDSCSPVMSAAVYDEKEDPADMIFSTPPVDSLTTSMQGNLFT